MPVDPPFVKAREYIAARLSPTFLEFLVPSLQKIVESAALRDVVLRQLYSTRGTLMDDLFECVQLHGWKTFWSVSIVDSKV